MEQDESGGAPAGPEGRPDTAPGSETQAFSRRGGPPGHAAALPTGP